MALDNTETVKIIHGASDGTFTLVGVRIGKVRECLVDAFNIPKDALAFVNCDQVDADYVLEANDTLEFCKLDGRKGMRRMFTQAEIRSNYNGIPTSVFGELFAELPPCQINSQGDPIWYEQSVDAWLDSKYFSMTTDDGRDKVIPPNSIRLDGKVYHDLTPDEWRLMESLFTKGKSGLQTVKIDTVIEHVWGLDEDQKDGPLTQHIKRLNKKLQKQGCRATINKQNGFVTITK